MHTIVWQKCPKTEMCEKCVRLFTYEKYKLCTVYARWRLYSEHYLNT